MKETMDIEDLKQYLTNLLYHVYNEGRNMDMPEFDKWVEENINNINEYFKYITIK